MLDEQLRRELLAMRVEDKQVRDELVWSGELGGHYVPRMEVVHVANAARLQELIAAHGWPTTDTAGEDGAEAAWFIAQHAIGAPDFQRQALELLKECSARGQVPAWHAAYLEDRIAMQDGRPQRYGTQWIDDPEDGRIRPWKMADADRVNELRAAVGLKPMPPIPERGPKLSPGQREAIEDNQRWWQQWLKSKGWSG